MVISSLKRKINPLFRSIPNILKNKNYYYLFIKLVFNINTYIFNSSIKIHAIED